LGELIRLGLDFLNTDEQNTCVEITEYFPDGTQRTYLAPGAKFTERKSKR